MVNYVFILQQRKLFHHIRYQRQKWKTNFDVELSYPQSFNVLVMILYGYIFNYIDPKTVTNQLLLYSCTFPIQFNPFPISFIILYM
jgi:hypothetical protein